MSPRRDTGAPLTLMMLDFVPMQFLPRSAASKSGAGVFPLLNVRPDPARNGAAETAQRH